MNNTSSSGIVALADVGKAPFPTFASSEMQQMLADARAIWHTNERDEPIDWCQIRNAAKRERKARRAAKVEYRKAAARG